ncbi:hypothetical protein HWV62_16930 [Athelia sp. TMB]|nr:hypothetical protein HWV62_16930 [Athelia sp. TMB]
MSSTTTTSPNSKRKLSVETYAEGDEEGDGGRKLAPEDDVKRPTSGLPVSHKTGSPSKKLKKAKTPKTTKPPATNPSTWRQSQVPVAREKLQARHNNTTKKGKQTSREPARNVSRRSDTVSQPLDPALEQLKAQFPQPWIFNACLRFAESCYGGIESSSTLAKEYLKIALLDIRSERLRHPLRPIDLLPSSTSIDQLRDVLKRAPRIPDDGIGNVPTGMRTEVENFPHQGAVRWYWASTYLDEVNKALIAVINEHGVGDGGWKTARWEVYDKVSPVIQI